MIIQKYSKDTMVRIRKDTLNDLKAMGKMGDTYNILIKDLIKKNKKRKDLSNYYKLLKKLVKKYWIKCQSCPSRRAIVVHHVDHNRKNNTIENLKFLCKQCHKNKHYPHIAEKWKKDCIPIGQPKFPEQDEVSQNAKQKD